MVFEFIFKQKTLFFSIYRRPIGGSHVRAFPTPLSLPYCRGLKPIPPISLSRKHLTLPLSLLHYPSLSFKTKSPHHPSLSRVALFLSFKTNTPPHTFLSHATPLSCLKPKHQFSFKGDTKASPQSWSPKFEHMCTHTTA